MTAAASIKAALRAEMRRRRRAVPAATRVRVANAICERLLALPLGGVVAVYLAGADEIDLSSFLSAAAARGVRLLAPRWTGETYALADLDGLTSAHVRVGPHGILEPRLPFRGANAAEAARLPTAWLVPGLAFARDGGRLGYGGGWYDRLLAAADPKAQALGIAHEFQLVDELPSEPHDRRLSGVVCASGLVAAKGDGGRG